MRKFSRRRGPLLLDSAYGGCSLIPRSHVRSTICTRAQLFQVTRLNYCYTYGRGDGGERHTYARPETQTERQRERRERERGSVCVWRSVSSPLTVETGYMHLPRCPESGNTMGFGLLLILLPMAFWRRWSRSGLDTLRTSKRYLHGVVELGEATTTTTTAIAWSARAN